MSTKFKAALLYGKKVAKQGEKRALKYTIELIVKAGYTYADIRKIILSE